MGKGIFLLLGSNLGDREKNLLLAIKKITGLKVTVPALSSLYKTQPWGKVDQPEFLNQVIELDCDFSPRELLGELQKIEGEIGEKSKERWGPREIDIDILFFGNQIVNDPDLVIPHPGIPHRRFTLMPFCEIAPDFVHPQLMKTCKQLLSECSDSLAISLYQPNSL